MAKLGIEVTSRAARAPRGEPTDTGVAFAMDFAEWGPHDEAVLIQSLDDFTKTFGARVSYSQLADFFELAFAEGLATAYVARQVGPAPIKGSRTLVDRAGAPLNTLRIDALYVGDRGNRIAVEVLNGTAADTFKLLVRFDGLLVETFDNLTMNAAVADYAVTRLATSDYVRGVDLNSVTVAPNDNPAVVASAALAGGTDDRAAAVQAQFDAALAKFTKDLGPGQVCAPGRTTQTQHEALMNHAAANNRTAYLDAPDQASKATLLGAAAAISSHLNAQRAGLFGSWFDIPGLVGGTTRAVPGSAFACGVTARTDALEGTAGAAPAGEVSGAQFATAVREPAGGFSISDFDDLNDAGINMARNFRNRLPQLYGFRSVTTETDWTQLTAHRLRMSLHARLEAVAVPFPFRTIDGRGHLFAEYNGVLAGVCLDEYNKDALFGETPEDAFRVDTGETVNTPITIADKQIRAVVYARFSPFAELAKIELIKVPTTSSV